MGLRFRFNLALTVVFVFGLGASAYLSYGLLQNNARDEVVRNAELMIQTARAIRSYTVKQVRPQLKHHMVRVFLPQSVPAYAAAETLALLPAEYKDFVYKEATLNPTNPRNRASDWEADLIREFRRNAKLKTLSGQRQTPRGKSLYIASPMRITNPACLSCHNTPKTAPKTLLARYGNSNGFGWKLNEIIGAQVVSVPMAVAIAKADRAFITFMVSLGAVFLILYIVLNLMLDRMVLKPIVRMSKAADAVSTGDFEVPEFAGGRKDEIGRLATSFNRMRRSLEQALGMLDK
ncbi:MAG: c-type heme family protein [Alphaproteobacteria bacterium]